jgi:hypothetical protein
MLFSVTCVSVRLPRRQPASKRNGSTSFKSERERSNSHLRREAISLMRHAIRHNQTQFKSERERSNSHRSTLGKRPKSLQ